MPRIEPNSPRMVKIEPPIKIMEKNVKAEKNWVFNLLVLSVFSPLRTLNATADISVKVFNIMGQLVDVIAEGTYSPSTYNWTWNAENLASGVYLVRTQVGSNVDTQKIMLLK